MFQSPGAARQEIDFSEFLDQVQNNNIIKVTISGNQAKGKFATEDLFNTVAPTQFDDLVKELRDHNVKR